MTPKAEATKGEVLPLISSLECELGNSTVSSHTQPSTHHHQPHPPSPPSLDGITTTTNHHPSSSSGTATVEQTSWNIAKTCMGTGTLALPFAAVQGGILFATGGIGFISLWNCYTVDRLLKCYRLMMPRDDGGKREGGGGGFCCNEREEDDDDGLLSTVGDRECCYRSVVENRVGGEQKLTVISSSGIGGVETTERQQRWNDNDGFVEEQQQQQQRAVDVMPIGTSTYGAVAWHAFGIHGLYVLDSVMMILLLGVIIAYEDAIISLIRATPFTTGSSLLDSTLTLFIIAPLSCLPNVGFLSRSSAMGLFAIYFTFCVILGYGLVQNGVTRGLASLTWDDFLPHRDEDGGEITASYLVGISRCFGVIVFGFGATPLTFNFRDSMAEPTRMMDATKRALWLIFATYSLFGAGVVIVFKPDGRTFDGDVLEHLPVGTWIPTTVRLAMVYMVMVTAPLIVIPCGELMEGMMGSHKGRHRRGSNGSDDDDGWRVNDLMSRIMIRTSICVFCTFVSVLMPDFVSVLSLIGCVCVSLTSLVFPPLFYIALVARINYRNDDEQQHRRRRSSPMYKYPSSDGSSTSIGSVLLKKCGNKWMIHLIPDVIMLLWGVFISLLSSILTLRSILSPS